MPLIQRRFRRGLPGFLQIARRPEIEFAAKQPCGPRHYSGGAIHAAEARCLRERQCPAERLTRLVFRW
jgi:hypothetical protein